MDEILKNNKIFINDENKNDASTLLGFPQLAEGCSSCIEFLYKSFISSDTIKSINMKSIWNSVSFLNDGMKYAQEIYKKELNIKVPETFSLSNKFTSAIVKIINYQNLGIIILITLILLIIEKIQKYYENIKSYSLSYCSLYQYEDLAIFITPRKDKKTLQSEEIRKFLIEIVDTFQTKISEKMKEEQTNNNIYSYINQKLSSIIQSIKKIKLNQNPSYFLESIKESLNEFDKQNDDVVQNPSYLLKSIKESLNGFDKQNNGMIQNLEDKRNPFIVNILNTNKNFFLYNEEVFLKNYDSIINFYNKFILNLTQNFFIKEFCDFLLENELVSFDDSVDYKDNKPIEKVIFEKIEKEKKFYLFFYLFKIIIENLVDQRSFERFFTVNIEDKSPININDDHFINTKSYSMNLHLNRNKNFVLKVKYTSNKNRKDEEIPINVQRENRIFEKFYSKFVVHLNGKDRLGNAYIPHFPLGTIDSLFNGKLSLIDKVVILLEIATALKDLHSRNEFHGELCDSSILINSSKDAYMCGFSYDRGKEDSSSLITSIIPIFYRKPSMFEIKDIYIKEKYKIDKVKLQNNEKDINKMEDEKKNETDKDIKEAFDKKIEKLKAENKELNDKIEKEKKNIKKQTENFQLGDIYSFGVLMFEIITEIKPLDIFKDKGTYFIFQTLKSNKYTQALFEKGKEILRKESFDFLGDSTIGMEAIITKCMETDPNKCYESIKDVIDDIKNLPIYIINQEEIDFRIKSSKSSYDYKCNLSDIVCSYFLGKKKSIDDIEFAFNKNLNNSSFKITNDIIQNIIETMKMSHLIFYNINENIFYILYMSIRQFSYPKQWFFDRINAISNYYSDYQSACPSKIDIYKSFNAFLKDTKLLDIKFDNVLTIEIIESEFEEIYLTIKKTRKYSILNFLFHQIIEKLIDTNIFKKQYFMKFPIEEDFKNEEYHRNTKYIDLGDSVIFSEPSYSTKILFDKDFNFYIQLRYSEEINKRIIKREIDYYQNVDYKFVVHLADQNKKRDNILLIPLFPLGTLNSILETQDIDNKRSFRFTNIDKFVIIYEIAEGLNQLHQKNKFHSNLFGSSIFLSASKDAYIGYFSYSRANEPHGSKSRGPIYCRAPEIAKYVDEYESKPANSKDDEEKFKLDIKKEIKGDIYSYGVLAHEVLTDTIPEKRFGNKPREERLRKLSNGKYSKFLFKGNNNEIFFDKSQGFEGMKEIIEDCMNNDNEKRPSMEKVMERLRELEIYKNNKKEIDYRIEQAKDEKNYKCSFSDIVECVFRGQTRITPFIYKVIDKYKEVTTDQSIIDPQDDLIKYIFDNFDIGYEDYTPMFEELFAFIIENNTKSLIHENFIINLCDNLLNASIYSNNLAYNNSPNMNIREGNVEIITPVSSLSDFIDHNRNYVANNSITWAYFIAKDILEIHTKNLYHGNITADSIGVYFNTVTNTFIPFVIPYYYFYIGSEDLPLPPDLHKDRSNLEKRQRKDKKDFIKLIKNFGQISDVIISELNSLNTMNEVLFYLYNYISDDKMDEFKKNSSFLGYHNFIISYKDLPKMIDVMEIQDINLLKFNMQGVLNDIDKFLGATIVDPDLLIGKAIPTPVVDKTKNTLKTDIDKIKKLFKNIGLKAYLVMRKIFKDVLIINEYDKDLFEVKENSYSYTRSIPKDDEKKIERPVPMFDIIKKKRQKQDRKWFRKFVFRRVEITELCQPSVIFLMRRYLLNLNPRLNFKITVKILNKTYSHHQDKPVKADDLINIAKDLGFTNAGIEDGNVTIIIQNTKRGGSNSNNNDNDDNDNCNDDNDDNDNGND